jgi:hypothetical protein
VKVDEGGVRNRNYTQILRRRYVVIILCCAISMLGVLSTRYFQKCFCCEAYFVAHELKSGWEIKF